MGRRGGSWRRRSPLEWGIRITLVLAAMVVGWTSVTHSLAQVLDGRDAARAYRLAPGDGRIAARLAQARLAGDQTPAAQQETTRLARRALQQDATAVRAIATLGLQAQLRGDTGQARRLFAYSQQLSRRDLPTQIWAIEDSVARGDIAGALRYYDLALRTSRTAPDILFPVLGSAITEPAVQSHLVAILSRRPLWGPGFIAWLAGNGTDPQAKARLFLRIKQAGMPLSSEATAAAANGLIAADAMGDAWRFYASVRPDANLRRSRDPRFTANLSTPSLFDWQPINDASVATSIQRGPRGGILDFSVPPSTGGALVQQLQMLPPGTYQIKGHSIGIEQPDASLPYWALTCRDGRELGRVVVPNSAQANGSFAGRFDVPPGCPVQTLTLIAKPSDDIMGVAGQIDHVRLIPVG